MPEIMGLNLKAVWFKFFRTPEDYFLRKREKGLRTKMRKIVGCSSSAN